MTKRIDEMTAEEFDEYFDDGGDVSALFEVGPIERPVREAASRQISITVPMWLVESLGAEAERRGIARKAVINTALVEWTDTLAEHRRGCVA